MRTVQDDWEPPDFADFDARDVQVNGHYFAFQRYAIMCEHCFVMIIGAHYDIIVAMLSIISAHYHMMVAFTFSLPQRSIMRSCCSFR